MEITELGNELREKLDKLIALINGYENLAVAFSGGVDSTFLLKIAHEELEEGVLALYVDSPLQPRRERENIHELAKLLRVNLHVLTVENLDQKAFVENPKDRCYWCKGFIFDQILEVSHLKGINYIADGSNLDDNKDYRPGAKALRERSVVSPLKEAGLTKQDIRTLSRYYDLPTWNKDALACLATRIPFGEPVTPEKLQMVDRAEEILVNAGFNNVRARYFGEKVKLEVRDDQVKTLTSSPNYQKIESQIKNLGFSQIEIAEGGYKQGSMNVI